MIEFLRFTVDDNLLLVYRDSIVLFKSESNTEEEIFKLKAKCTSIQVYPNNLIIATGIFSHNPSDDQGYVYLLRRGDGEKLNAISFQAYKDHRVKALKYFEVEKLMVTITTEGTVSVWDIGFIVDKLEYINGFDLELGDKVESLYSFSIETRLISLDCRLDEKKAKESEEEILFTASSKNKGKSSGIHKLIKKPTRKERLTKVSFSIGRLGARSLLTLRKLKFCSRVASLKKELPE